MNDHRMHARASRRTFLACCTTAVVLAPAALRATGQRLPRLTFDVVSDTHLGYRDGQQAAQQWERTAAELARSPSELVLHLGDVVDGGRESQYAVYRDIRRQIGKRVYEIPGNHDPAELFARHLRDEVDTVVDHQWLRFLLLNDARRDSHDGFLAPEQLDWIDRQCREAQRTDRRVALALHVPAHANRHPDRGWYIKPDDGQRALYELLQQYRQCVLCLMHGHFHNGLRGWDDHAPLHEIVFPSALYNLDRRLAEQQAPGYNLPEFRPGFTRVTIHGGTMKLQYQPTGQDQHAVKELPLAAEES
jgi:calcineurin-like phosphoesterase family protein